MKNGMPLIGKAAIFVGVLAILLILEPTRIILGAIGAFIGGLLLWILGLFLTVFILIWAISKFSKKK